MAALPVPASPGGSSREGIYCHQSGKREKGAGALKRVFDGVADVRVAKPDHQNEQDDANQAARPTFPDEKDGQQREDRDKKVIPAKEGHYLVEDRIAQGTVDEPEKLEVHCLQPMHGRNNLTIKDRLKMK